MRRFLKIHLNLPQHLWLGAFSTAVFLINRLPTTALNSKSPYEHLFHRAPKYMDHKVFGCTCFPFLAPYSSNNNLSSKSIPCLFLGYDNAHKGYQCLEPISGKLYISRHVTFDETSFPYKQTAPPASSPRRCHSDFRPLLTTISDQAASRPSPSSPPLTAELTGLSPVHLQQPSSSGETLLTQARVLLLHLSTVLVLLLYAPPAHLQLFTAIQQTCSSTQLPCSSSTYLL